MFRSLGVGVGHHGVWGLGGFSVVLICRMSSLKYCETSIIVSMASSLGPKKFFIIEIPISYIIGQPSITNRSNTWMTTSEGKKHEYSVRHHLKVKYSVRISISSRWSKTSGEKY